MRAYCVRIYTQHMWRISSPKSLLWFHLRNESAARHLPMSNNIAIPKLDNNFFWKSKWFQVVYFVYSLANYKVNATNESANLVWTLGKRNERSGPGAQKYCSNEDGCSSPAMKRRSFYPRVQGHNSSVVRSPMWKNRHISRASWAVNNMHSTHLYMYVA